jgi:hypothetical protein
MAERASFVLPVDRSVPMTDIKRNDNDGARQTVVVINRLRARPASLEDAIATVNIAADEIDRLLTAINNAQSALTYEGLSAEKRNHAASASLHFADR